MRPSPFGLSEYEAITDAISTTELSDNSVTPSWPYPQIFRGAQTTLLVDETALFTVDENDWSLTAVTTYDAANTANTKAIDAGGSWHFVDFQDCWLLFNGACFVYKRADNAKTLVRTKVIRTACEHNQRMFIGGLDALWDSSWTTLVNGWLGDEPAGFDESLTTNTNLVFWTNVGTLALFWDLFDTTVAVAGDLSTHSSGNPLAAWFINRGDWGFAPMPYPGRVLAVRPLGNSVIAYSEGGVARLTPVSAPVPSCSVTPLTSIGIMGRSSIAATRSRHLWLSNKGELWQTTADGVSRLDFGEYGALLNSPIIGAADEEEGLLYLSDGDTALFQTETGLAKAPECPTSIIQAAGTTRGVVFEADDTSVEVVVNATDFGIRGAKTLDEVRVAGDLPVDGTATIAVEYRNYGSESFTRDAEIELNNEGVARVHLTADEFQFAVLVDAYSGVSIDYIEVTFRLYDVRYTERLRPRSYSDED